MGAWTLIIVFQGVIGPSRALTTAQIPGFSSESTAKEAGSIMMGQTSGDRAGSIAYYYAVEVK